MVSENRFTQEFIVPRHLGIIMDGNGRWAQARGLPRSAGHEAGLQTVRRVTEMCVTMGIPLLTLYAFSTENWLRPSDEVDFLMTLLEKYAVQELPELQKNGICLQWMGKREGLPESTLEALDRAIHGTCKNSRLVLNLAVNYGGRTEIVDAIISMINDHQQGVLAETRIDEDLIGHYLYCPDCPDTDLVIRTSGEWRLSNFLLWRSANAVFVSLPVLWPDFQEEHLNEAIGIFSQQYRESYAGA